MAETPAQRRERLPAPVCPDDETTPYPPYAKIGEQPSVATWRELVTLPVGCHISLQNPAALTVSISGLFSYAGSVEEIALRLGAISKTQGLTYWSVTNQKWRELISDAYALESLNVKSVRSDFVEQEILSGENLFFAQNDTRSWGLNVYSIRTISSSADHLVLESHNASSVRFGPITIFKPDDALSILFFHRLDTTTWKYYSLSVIKSSALSAPEKSLINRQAALFRFLTNQKLEMEPPLAR